VARGDLAAEDDAEQVDPGDLAEIAEIDGDEVSRQAVADAGIVEHDVQPAEMVDGAVDQRLDLVALRDVGLLEDHVGAELIGQRLPAGFVPVGDGDLGALLDEQLDRGPGRCRWRRP